MRTQEQLDRDKEAFFAQYWGQTVVRFQKDKIWKATLDREKYPINEKHYLELRSIESLTQPECIEIVKLQRGGIEYVGFETFKLLFISEVLGEQLGQRETDYLRSIGILIPFRDYSVEELLTLGWAKIK